jgi:hypothetical protein
VFDSWTRLLQTVDTISSIRARDPSSIIVLIEMAAIPLQTLQHDVLVSLTDYQIDFTNDNEVKALYNSTDNWDVVKNVNEVMCFAKALDYLKSSPINVDRYFKVSGRYTLTDNFDPAFYIGKDNYVFAKRRNSQFNPTITGNCLYQYMSRCWSFPSDKLLEVQQAYHGFVTFMLARLRENGYVDIEHCLYRAFGNDKKTLEIEKIGVVGNIGPNGMQVED